jgi:hypothetical protein
MQFNQLKRRLACPIRSSATSPAASSHESGIKDAGTGDFRGRGPPGLSICAPRLGGENGYESKNDKPADFDLEMAVFGELLRSATRKACWHSQPTWRCRVGARHIIQILGFGRRALFPSRHPARRLPPLILPASYRSSYTAPNVTSAAVLHRSATRTNLMPLS